ncbi:hypothetical protein ACOXQX_004358 [Escherichia coli O169]
MTEIDVLNSVKFTDGNGVMHLFPEEEEGRNSFLPFRYIMTKTETATEDNGALELLCSIREREFFIPDGGINIYKDLYCLDPLAFLLEGNGYVRYWFKEKLELLGYSSDEIENRVINNEYFFKFVPVIDDAADLLLLESGQTYADAFNGRASIIDGKGYQPYTLKEKYHLRWVPEFECSIWSPDLMNGISITDFFGDREDWKKELKECEKIKCCIDTLYEIKTVKVIQ